jgi:hypothetical protein
MRAPIIQPFFERNAVPPGAWNRIYTPLVTLWVFPTQILCAGPCHGTLARFIANRLRGEPQHSRGFLVRTGWQGLSFRLVFRLCLRLQIGRLILRTKFRPSVPLVQVALGVRSFLKWQMGVVRDGNKLGN